MSPLYTRAVIALGSNLGERSDTLSAAVADLVDPPEVRLLAISPIVQTKAVGGPPGQPDFLNMVIAVETSLPPRELLEHCHDVEQKHLRVREVRWGPRTLDVDIITYGDVVSSDPELTLPHPRAAERAFVLYPWSLIDPAAELNGERVGDLAAKAADFADLATFDGFQNQRCHRDHRRARCGGAAVKLTSPLLLLAICVVLAVAGWFATMLSGRYGLATPVLPLTGLVTMGVIVALTLVLGIRVLRWRNGKKKKILNPILAAWTLVLAQACAYTGTVLLGWHAGIVVEQLRLWNLRSNQDITWQALAMAGGGLIMVIVGLVVERFCRIPPEDGDADSRPGVQGKRSKPSAEGEYAYRSD